MSTMTEKKKKVLHKPVPGAANMTLRWMDRNYQIIVVTLS